MRGLACLAILAYHVKPHAVPGGWAAVDLFFVLSGYLITTIILKHSHEPRFLFHFYVRRGLRIWPIYYLTVLLLATAVPFLPRPYELTGLFPLLTYTQNVPRYWSGTAPEFTPYLTHCWSLAVEEQFYLFWPLLVSVAGRRRVVPLAVGLLAVSVASRAYGLHWWLLLARGDGLALGALLAALRPGTGAARAVRLRGGLYAAVAASLAYLAALTATGGMSTVGTPRWPALTLLAVNLLAFGVVGLVLDGRGRPSLRPLRARWLVAIGVLSYGLYMYHYIVLLLFDDLARRLGMHGRPFWREAVAVASIVVLASLSWRYVERPILRLKRRFNYGPDVRPEAGEARRPKRAVVGAGYSMSRTG